MRFILTALLLSLTLVLMGCGHTAPLVVSTPVLVAPPDHLLLDCPVAAPPSKAVYYSAGKDATREEAAEKREKLLADFGGAQTKNIAGCNIRWKALRDWKIKEREIFEKATKDAESKPK